eukprot:GHVP01040553.1.p1 GENE.GHVP01040553.1~~GHVP01040553.1.p1  ORF type:complete len:519 (+),score=63.13 GHVP01040553.1:1402-2958(+)
MTQVDIDLRRNLLLIINKLSEKNMTAVFNQLLEIKKINKDNETFQTTLNETLIILFRRNLIIPQKLVLLYSQFIFNIHNSISNNSVSDLIDTLKSILLETTDAHICDNIIRVFSILNSFGVISDEYIEECISLITNSAMKVCCSNKETSRSNTEKADSIYGDSDASYKNMNKEEICIILLEKMLKCIKYLNRKIEVDLGFLEKNIKTKRGVYILQEIKNKNIGKPTEIDQIKNKNTEKATEPDHIKHKHTVNNKESDPMNKLNKNNTINRIINTEIRKRIFNTIIKSSSGNTCHYELKKLKLNSNQEREIIRVLLVCYLLEKTPNLFYMEQIEKLCRENYSHKVTVKYCIWDYLNQMEAEHGNHCTTYDEDYNETPNTHKKEENNKKTKADNKTKKTKTEDSIGPNGQVSNPYLIKMSTKRRDNLSIFCSYLIKKDCILISDLRIIKSNISFLKGILESFILNCDEDTIKRNVDIMKESNDHRINGFNNVIRRIILEDLETDKNNTKLRFISNLLLKK